MTNQAKEALKMKGMLKWSVGSVVLLGLTVMLVGQVKPPKDPLAEWAYPKAKRGKEGTTQPPLVWTTFTTLDSFEKVWDFYWGKVTRGAPVKPAPGAMSGTLYSGPPDPKQQVICAHFHNVSPAGKLGIFVIREFNRTVSVTITQRAKERQTLIVVAVDQR